MGDEKVPCPVCRKQFIVPENGLRGLPKNFFIEKLLQIKRLAGSQNAAACEVCERRRKTAGEKMAAASKYCVECQQNLCEGCSADHESYRMFRDHKLVDLDDLRGAEGEEVFRTTTTYCT